MGKYKIYKEDIWHQPLTDVEDINNYQVLMKEFDSYEEALTYCCWYLDETFKIISQTELNEDGFRNYWAFWGEALYISPTGGESFSARAYIEEKINKHYKNKKYEIKQQHSKSH